MPRYFFQFTDGRQRFTDSTGVELPSILAVRQHAARQIRELRGLIPDVNLQNWLGWKIIAVDSIGNPVYEIGFDFTQLADPKMRQRNFVRNHCG